MQSNLQHFYRVALALNNVGVSLLEQGLYRIAGEAFQKSLLVLKHLADSESHPSMFMDYHQADELLRRLSQFVSPHRIQETFTGPRFVSLDDDELNAGGKLSTEDGYLSSFTIIRLRGSTSDSLDELEFEAGVVSRHLGIVLSIEADISRKPFDKAMKLYRASYRLLNKCYSGDQGLVAQKKTISVTAMLLDNTQALLRLQGRSEEAFAAMKDLSNLRETIRGMEQLTKDQFHAAPMA